MPYLIDGYNLYHAAKKFHADWRDLTVLQLCLMINEHMKRIKDRAEIIFDGYSPAGRAEVIEERRFIDLIYGGATDADTLIEQYIRDNTAPRRLTVISSDRRIRTAAKRRKALALTSLEYLETMLKRLLSQRKRIPDPKEKRQGVPDGELNNWLDLFGIEPTDEEPGDDLYDLIR